MGQVIPVLIAGTIVIASISAVLYTIRTDVLDDSAVSDPADQAEADALLDILMDSAGLGWGNGVQNVTRLGLANGTGLDLEKMSAVEGGRYGSTYGSGGMDYDTARAGLGLDATRDFHVRVYPIDLGQDHLALLSDMETAYIGDWEELAEVVVQLGTEEQMSSSAQSSLNTTMGSGTSGERQLLTDLGVDFKDRVYITTKYPDVLVEVALGVRVPLPDVSCSTA